MENPVFVNEEDIPMVHQDDDGYDDQNTPNTSRIGETSFAVPDATEATSNLRLRHLNVTGDRDLIGLGRFKLTKNPKKVATIFVFYNSDRWVPLTKQTGEFFTPKTLKDRFGGVNKMKHFLGVDKTPPALERSFKAVKKLKGELPTDIEMESTPPEELSSMAEEIHVKTREASQNTDLDMREFLGLDKALQSIQSKLLNNTSK